MLDWTGQPHTRDIALQECKLHVHRHSVRHPVKKDDHSRLVRTDSKAGMALPRLPSAVHKQQVELVGAEKNEAEEEIGPLPFAKTRR